MRHRLLLAALLAGSAFSPALAQEVEATVSAESQAEAVVAAQPVIIAVADQENRRQRGDGGGRGRDFGNERMRAAPEQIERAPRQDWQQRQQAQPPVRVQNEPPVQPEWSVRRMRGNAENESGRWQRREAPVVMAPPQAPVADNRGWRGNDGNVSGNNGGNNAGGWQRRQAPVIQTPVQPPLIARQAPTEAGRNWRGNNGSWQRNGRDRDGTPNWRDRDRDNDGVRDNRDWDRNNNGRVDGRWDRNRNGTVDRRWDQNRDGVRDNRWNDRNWNGNGQNWSNNQRWNREWRNDRRYDWQRYRTSNRDLFRAPRYYSPYGNNYGYQRFGIGIYLESLFFGSRYQISDPWRYRLPDAQWPYEWVRYYDDVLLVDTRNGYVVDVIYDFFW
jgi:Nickel/cobalt transporter regulator